MGDFKGDGEESGGWHVAFANLGDGMALPDGISVTEVAEAGGQALVDKINGVRIEQLSDVPKAFAAAKGPFDVIDFLPDHHFEVLKHDDAQKATSDILATYSVPAQSRS